MTDVLFLVPQFDAQGAAIGDPVPSGSFNRAGEPPAPARWTSLLTHVGPFRVDLAPRCHSARVDIVATPRPREGRAAILDVDAFAWSVLAP